MSKTCHSFWLKDQEQEKKYIQNKLDNIRENNTQNNESKIQPKNQRNRNSSNIRTFKKSYSTMEFYALGKEDKDNKNLTKNNFMPSNNAFQSTSNDLLIRNYFSINNSHFDELQKKLFKSKSTVYEQNALQN